MHSEVSLILCTFGSTGAYVTARSKRFMQTEQLIKGCQNNDRKAQEVLFQRYAPVLFSICLRYSRDRAEAEDHLQDCFIQIFDKIGQFAFKGSFEGWLKRLTVTTVLQKYRSQGMFEVITHEMADDTAAITVDEASYSLEYLLRLVQELPDRYRLTFSLYVLDGYSHKEIARMLRISEGTSKSNLARAKVALRNRIETDQQNEQAQNL